MASPTPDDLIPLTVPPDRSVSAAVIVCEDGRYLLQLRDEKPGLPLPGHWALFGGGIEAGESAETALIRELDEELCFIPERIMPLCVTVQAIYPETPLFRFHFFTIPIHSADIGRMVQQEGADMGLFSVAEACGLAKISPWDLCAILFHARLHELYPEGLPAPLNSRTAP